ncbi:MAG: efflux RND transporter periplasmic adaptor subunit [Bacteroidales bacterium]
MKNRMKLFSNRYVQYGLIAIGGVFAGWLFFHTPRKVNENQQKTEQTAQDSATASNENIEPDAIRLTKEAAELANVQTSVVTSGKPVKEVRLYGKVQADERSIQSQTSHLPGRIEKLLINYTGETVRKGQPLVIIYSPELITAQQELLEAAKTKSLQPAIYEAAKERLLLWKLTDSQVEEIENSGKVKDNFEIVSNTDGVITDLRVNNGDHVDQGTVLFDVANLSDVWVMFDGYEKDLPFLNNGDRLTFTVQALPGVIFAGRITFIDPVINTETRVANVRVVVNNSSGRLKPGMFATGIVRADLSQYAGKMIIPRSSVLWTGIRSIVYVKQPGIKAPIFKMREIELGPSLVDSYVVLYGLNEGEEIVTNGTFTVDASAQLQGKPNMMNPQGGEATTMPGMNMPGMEMPKTGEKTTGILTHK